MFGRDHPPPVRDRFAALLLGAFAYAAVARAQDCPPVEVCGCTGEYCSVDFGAGTPGTQCCRESYCGILSSCHVVWNTPGPTPTATPTPTPTPRQPRMSPDAKKWLGIAVDVGKKANKVLGLQATAMAASGDIIAGAWGGAMVVANEYGLSQIQEMIDKDPYRKDYAKLAQPQPQTVPANIKGPMRRELLRVVKMEGEIALRAKITLDRAYSAEQDGNQVLEEKQQAWLDTKLLPWLANLLTKDANLRLTLAAKNPGLSALADPDYIEALRAAAKGLTP